MQLRTKSVFVLMPFKDEFDDVYLVIQNAAEAASRNLNIQIGCLRADEIAKPGRITEQIIQGIATADLLIADLSGNNPNVMYELGYGHALGKAAIIINQEVHTSPFDVKDFRQILYDRTRLMKDCRPSLLAALCDVFGTEEIVPVEERLPIAEPSDIDGTTSRARGAVAMLRPGSAVVATLQALHVRLQFANSKHNTDEARAVGKEVRDVLGKLTVASPADADDMRNTAGTVGNCAVELEKAELFEAAEDIYRRALGLFPDYPGLHLQYADYLVDLGKYDEANAELRRVRELSPGDHRLTRVEMKIALKTGGGTPEIAKELKERFERDPGNRTGAAAYLMYLDKSRAPLSEFEDTCRRWKEAAPSEEKLDAERALADYLASSDDRHDEDRALGMYEDLLSNVGLAVGDRAAILHNMATLYANHGKRDLARSRWREAYGIDPNDPAVKAAFSQRLANWGDMEAAMSVIEGKPLPDEGFPTESV